MKKILGKLIPQKIKTRLSSKLTQAKSYKLTFTEESFSPSSTRESDYKHQVDSNNVLYELGEKFKPTKRLPNYLIHYWKHFRDIHKRVTRVLEIGVESDKSIKMWQEFFPNAQIYGIDINPNCKAYEGGSIKIFIGDQSDEKFLQSVLQDAGGFFDVIIDDGSHRVFHQLKTFDFLFPHLTSHGVYVIEDTGACVGDTQLKTIGKVQELVKNIMYFPKDIPFSDWSKLSQFPSSSTWADRNIVGVSFYRWICFIEKGHNPEDNSFLG